MPIREIDRIKHRYLFYRFNYGRVVTVMWAFLIIVILQLIVVAYLIVSGPNPRYLATSYAGLLYEIHPFDEPNFFTSALNEWATD